MATYEDTKGIFKEIYGKDQEFTFNELTLPLEKLRLDFINKRIDVQKFKEESFNVLAGVIGKEGLRMGDLSRNYEKLVRTVDSYCKGLPVLNQIAKITGSMGRYIANTIDSIKYQHYLLAVAKEPTETPYHTVLRLIDQTKTEESIKKELKEEGLMDKMLEILYQTAKQDTVGGGGLEEALLDAA
ncbi:MAG: hypothetical protein PHT54_02340 [Candidatus Nanoarchaeia archaeon]|nr:hypothetical protein [Candidatus Nanoarchaeia archaeon]